MCKTLVGCLILGDNANQHTGDYCYPWRGNSFCQWLDQPMMIPGWFLRGRVYRVQSLGNRRELQVFSKWRLRLGPSCLAVTMECLKMFKTSVLGWCWGYDSQYCWGIAQSIRANKHKGTTGFECCSISHFIFLWSTRRIYQNFLRESAGHQQLLGPWDPRWTFCRKIGQKTASMESCATMEIAGGVRTWRWWLK